MKPLSEKEKEHIMSEVNATMAMEGMPLTDKDKARLRRRLDDKATVDELIAEITKKHTR